MKKLLLVCFLLAFLVGTLFVLTLDRRFDAFGGDDATLSYSQRVKFASSTVHQCLVEAYGSKWRPVTSFANFATYRMFGEDARSYVLFNIVVHSLSAAMLALCIYQVLRLGESGRRLAWLPYLAAVLYAFQGFSYYNFTQRFGLMEELCVLFSLSMLCLGALKGRDMLRMTAVLVLLALSCLTHERFMALAVYASLFPFFACDFPVRRRLVLCMLPWVVTGLYLFIKGPILKAGLLMGTGSQDIELGGWGLWQRMLSVALNILGYNHGPLHLSAYESSRGWFYIALSLLVICTVVVLSRAKVFHREALGRVVLLWGAALLPLVLSASVCFRIEFRWMLAPWAVFVAWLSALLLYLLHSRAQWQASVIIALAVGWVGITAHQSIAIRRTVENLFFMYWTRDAESFKNCVERNYIMVYTPVQLLIESPCDEGLIRDYLNRSKYKLISFEEFDRMSEAERADVVSLKHFYCGWSFESRKGR